MTKRFACPDCHTPMTADPAVDRTAACPKCGYRAGRRAKPAGRAQPAGAGVENGARRVGARPKKRRPKGEGRKQAGPAASAVRWWVAVAAGGLFVVGVVAVVLLLRGGGVSPEQQVEADREAIRQAAPVNEFPPVAWTLRPGPGPKVVFPNRLTVEYEKGFAHAVSLPGRGPSTFRARATQGWRSCVTAGSI